MSHQQLKSNSPNNRKQTIRILTADCSSEETDLLLRGAAVSPEAAQAAVDSKLFTRFSM